MKIIKDVVIRTVAGESMLIPVGETVREYNGIFTLTAVGATIFEAIQNGQEPDALLQTVLNEYEIDEPTAKRDLDAFLDALRGFGIIQ